MLSVALPEGQDEAQGQEHVRGQRQRYSARAQFSGATAAHHPPELAQAARLPGCARQHNAGRHHLAVAEQAQRQYAPRESDSGALQFPVELRETW